MKVEEISVTILGAVYLLGVILASAITGNHPALALGVTAAGVSYIAQVAIAFSAAGVPQLDKASTVLWALAVLLAWAAGMLLVFKGA